MSTPLIVAGAPVADPARYADIVHDAGYLIAADSGADLCMDLGRAPDLFVGDADSVCGCTLDALREAGVTVELSPSDKDVSDLDLALSAAMARGLRDVMVTAAWGGRADHTLAVVGSLFDACSLSPILVEPGEFRAWVLGEQCRARLDAGTPGQTLSILPGPSGATVSVSGTHWPLEHARLAPLSRTGLSNVVNGSGAQVAVHAGIALVVLDESDRDGAAGIEG